MALTIITGPAANGKSERIRSAVRRALDQALPVTLILDGPHAVADARLELAPTLPLGARIVSLHAWAESLWMLMGDGRRLVSPTVRDQIAESAAEDEWPDDATRRGVARLVARTAQLWDLRAIVTASNKLPVLPVLRRYRTLLTEKGLVEPAEAFAMLAEADLPAEGLLAVDDFPSSVPWAGRLLAQAARRTDVVVAVEWDPAVPVLRGAADALERLMAVASSVERLHAEPRSEGLELAATFFSDQPAIRSSGGVVFGTAAGEEAEIALVVGQVESALAELVPPEEIAVAYRRLDGRAAHLSAALRAQGVEVEVDMQARLDSLPFGRALLSLSALVLGEGGRETASAFLSGPYSGATTDEAIALDLRWRSRREGSAAALLSDMERAGGAVARAVRAARATSVGDSGSRLSAWRTLLRALLSNGASRGGGDASRLTTDAAAHAAAAAAIEGLVLDAGVTDLRSLVRALRRVSVAVTPSGRRGAVRMVDAHRLARPVRVLILGGLNADEIGPRPEDELLLDLASRLGLPPGADTRTVEDARFYSIITKARERLVLVRSTQGPSGETRRPSVYWEEALARYGGRREDEDMPPQVPHVGLALTDLAVSAPAYSRGRREARQRAQAGGRRVNRRGVLTTPETLAELAERDRFAVTDLEKYLGCPYRWFYERVVSPREVDRELGAREIGSFVHELLRDFYTAFLAAGHERVTAENLSEALGLLDSRARALAERLRPQNLSEDLDLRRATDSVRAFLMEDAAFLPGWRPVLLEQEFGKDDDAPFVFGGVVLHGRIDRADTDGSAVVVTDYKLGRGHPGRKSFASKSVLQPVVYAQAAAGLLDAEPAGGLYRSLRSIEARGWWRSDKMDCPEGGSSRDAVSEQEWVGLVQETEELVRAAVEGIRGGDIRPRPRDANACKHCSAAPICGRPAW